ncbi:nucleotide exchange factor GrpE [Sporomusa acidovorans]|uniref:Protein GrpE n=1 Tax=Sporomusa acidovorans (strain ATCC 49682 / DSM 3132 / Mol) TaxID=1123286 RepID=A0ABZ3J4L5_SPOA4|nr:nucleotide exchange factor GrpE [Sporomusa acidovorans]OZC23111.1 protein GrpE [Sporomusa acidovorans DSM 3132]SDF05787.1 molecular chaperone GrpE [Sporomusa acidovorans]
MAEQKEQEQQEQGKKQEQPNLNSEQAQLAAKQKNSQANAATEENPEICFVSEDVSKVMAALEEKNRLLEEMTDRYKRLQADFDNFRRRTRQEKEELSAIVAEQIICELLPVVDNFERATTSEATDVDTLAKGVQMIFRQLNNALVELGVEPINAVGNIFDPTQHEAVMRVEDANQPDGMIIEELQKGYKVKGRLVRPSMVKVVGN